jgi:hypothetical protein
VGLQCSPLSSSMLGDEIMGTGGEGPRLVNSSKMRGGNRGWFLRSVASPTPAAIDFTAQHICEYRLVLCFDLLSISE